MRLGQARGSNKRGEERQSAVRNRYGRKVFVIDDIGHVWGVLETCDQKMATMSTGKIRRIHEPQYSPHTAECICISIPDS